MNRPAPWTNWAGNQTYAPAELAYPMSEPDVVAIVERAAAAGHRVRAIGTGHSSMNLSGTDGVIVNLRQLHGLSDVDRSARSVRLGPGTLISEIGPLLWPHGLCLKNQGDIDAQQIAGAVATGTHGSGLGLQSLSASIKAVDLVAGDGAVVSIGNADTDLLAAAQVSLGMLGVMTSLQIEVRDAFYIHEQVEYWSLNELLDRWPTEFGQRLHFSFFWMPATESPGIFKMRVPDGVDMADRVYVKIYDEVPMQPEGDLERLRRTTGNRIDRPYRIYPEVPTDVFHELEYMVPFERGIEAFEAVRDHMLNAFPDQKHPVEVRAVARDQAYLSTNYERDSLVIAVHCDDVVEGAPYLKAVGEVLEQLEARPHWGKLHFMESSYLEDVFPRLEDFRTVRRKLDPIGTFLNDYLAPLFN